MKFYKKHEIPEDLVHLRSCPVALSYPTFDVFDTSGSPLPDAPMYGEAASCPFIAVSEWRVRVTGATAQGVADCVMGPNFAAGAGPAANASEA